MLNNQEMTIFKKEKIEFLPREIKMTEMMIGKKE